MKVFSESITIMGVFNQAKDTALPLAFAQVGIYCKNMPLIQFYMVTVYKGTSVI